MATYSFSRAEQAPPVRGAPRMLYITRDQYSEDWNSNLHTHGCAELFFITDGHGRFQIGRAHV